MLNGVVELMFIVLMKMITVIINMQTGSIIDACKH